MQYYRIGFTSAWQKEKAASFDLLAMVMLVQPRLQLAYFSAKTHSWQEVNLSFTTIPRAFPPKLYSRYSVPVCICAWGYPSSRARLCIWPCLTSCGTRQPISPAYPRSFCTAALPTVFCWEHSKSPVCASSFSSLRPYYTESALELTPKGHG